LFYRLLDRSRHLLLLLLFIGNLNRRRGWLRRRRGRNFLRSHGGRLHRLGFRWRGTLRFLHFLGFLGLGDASPDERENNDGNQRVLHDATSAHGLDVANPFLILPHENRSTPS
jgi:hypothetical protein